MRCCGIYIHIPFCHNRCGYCDFYSGTGDQNDRARYVERLLSDISLTAGLLSDTHSPDTLFIGGGTPAILGPERLRNIIREVRTGFGNDLTEITVETTPEVISDLPFDVIDRVSIGIQSLLPESRDFLGRKKGREIDFSLIPDKKRINIDLIAGIPGDCVSENIKILENTLTIDNIDHVSVYMLSLNAYTGKKIIDMDDFEKKCVEDYLEYIDFFENKGFLHYEISNLCRPRYQCMHNLHYWNYDDYIGLGAGASGKLSDSHYKNSELEEFYNDDVTDIVRRLRNTHIPEKEIEKNRMMMQLRLKKGIYIHDFRQKNLPDILQLLYNKYEDMVIYEKDCFSLNRKGMLFYNTIISDLFISLEET